VTTDDSGGLRYVVAVDVGGTCTDCVIMDRDGVTTVGKAYSTPPEFTQGIVDSLTVGAEELGLTFPELIASTWLFLHSTTIAENAIATGDLARAGVVTTSGFRDTLFAMRGGFGRWSGLTEDEKRNPVETSKPPALVPVERIRTVKERIDREGSVVVELAQEDVERAVRELVDERVDSIGVCLLWSFANPAHEIQIREAVERLRPGLFVSLSHELAPVVGEYERTSTVALNAALGPVSHAYLRALGERLESDGFAGTVLVMQAHGGLLSAERARERPVSMIESGPVSGLLGCRRLGELIGVRNIIGADMGGTTFKVGAVRDGLIDYQHESQVFRYHYALPKMDVVSLGVAGGSIVSFDERTGIPQVGPRGAGSYPGPIVYGHGGSEPTVTDVDAILGFMNPSYFLGGRETLDVDLAREIFEREVADRLGLPLLEAAGAIYKLTNTYIHDLLHRTTVQRGLDPRQFVLFSTGGTAAMHLPAIGDELGVRGVVIPYTASVHGAFGLLTSDVVHEELLTKPMEHPADPAVVAELFDRLEGTVRRQLAGEGFDGDDVTVSRAVDMHYRRQVHEVTVPLRSNGDGISAAALEDLASDFTALYKQRYGSESTWPGSVAELVTFRVRGSGSLHRPELKRWEEGDEPLEHALDEVREVFIPGEGRLLDVPGYALERLAVGARIPGPALIWSPITTIVVGVEQSAFVDPYRNVIIERTEVPA
jgi:N-methylhydantoinase A